MLPRIGKVANPTPFAGEFDTMVTIPGRWTLLLSAGLVLACAMLAGLFGVAALEALEIGDRAPGFELPATTGGTVKLSQFQGKQAVLIEFYGADFAPA